MFPRLKKSLGQNFLTDKNVIKKIISSVAGSKVRAAVVEIGAGSGLFTEPLSEIYNEVYAVEFDKKLCEALKIKFAANKNIQIIPGDILKLKLDSFSHPKIDIFGNIPYYITTPIFLYLFRYKALLNKIFLTIQKEVFEKIKAKPGVEGYGMFSCLMQYFLKLDDSFLISKNSFFPAPKIDSTFASFSVRESFLKEAQEEHFLKVLKAVFSQRRKNIVNTLSKSFKKELVFAALKESNISPRIRAEELDLDIILKLAAILR